MSISFQCYDLIEAMAEKGNPNSISDAGVAALSIRSAIHGAYLNVKINLKDFDDSLYVSEMNAKAKDLFDKSEKKAKKILLKIDEVIS
jgi:glutamate formiminotransferase/formiminotetrahydrofolate cyclodeaminase